MNKEELYQKVIASQKADDTQPMTRKEFNKAIKELQARDIIMVDEEEPLATKKQNDRLPHRQ